MKPALSPSSAIAMAFWFAVASCCAASPQITRDGNVVALHNEEVRFEFDLSKGTYRILSDGATPSGASRTRG